MNLNKKLDRLKQWTNEKIGAESKTSVSEEFQALEAEMTIRHEGMERLHKSMTAYVKSISKQGGIEDKEKVIPVGHLGTTMISHGQDFDKDSSFGNCLTVFGQANENISRIQESYVASATSSWLESLERALAQMKEYQSARKKLEQRRLAYDASSTKLRNAKKEDYRAEEELRSQKAKYEESSDDVIRRMQDIRESELESLSDLGSFLEAELNYHDKCTEALLRAKREWAASNVPQETYSSRRALRARANTAHSFGNHQALSEEEPPLPGPDPRLVIRSDRVVSAGSSLRREQPGFDSSGSRPLLSRVTTFEGPSRLNRDSSRDSSPFTRPSISRVPTDSALLVSNKAQLRPIRTNTRNADVFGDPSDEVAVMDSSSPDRFDERSTSPATSYGSIPSRKASWSMLEGDGSIGKKAPPPPPPSRSKKAPPPPPTKRSALSTSEISYA